MHGDGGQVPSRSHLLRPLHDRLARPVLAAMVDVGRVTSTAEAIDMAGRTVATATQPTRSQTPAARSLARLLDTVCATAETVPSNLCQVVVGICSAYDARTDRLVNAEHLAGWSGPTLTRTLSDHLGVEVLVENDANLALLGEQDSYPAADPGSTVLLWLGDGVGLALAVDGTVHRGATGRAGEIGYVRARPLHSDDRRDLQSLLGRAGLDSLAAGYALPTGPDCLREAAALARSEDRGRGARAFLADVATLAGAALEPVIATLDPAAVVLGGPGGADGGSLLADLVAADLRERGRWFGQVRASRLGQDAVLAGCRVLATRRTRTSLPNRVAQPAEQVSR